MVVVDNYLSSMLANGEVILIETRQHWVAAIRYVLRPLVILLIAAFLVLFNNWLGWDDGFLGTVNDIIFWIAGLLFIVSLVWLPIDLVRWYSRRYVLTSRRAMRMQGVLRKSSIDSSLEQINDIRTEQSLLGRTLGYADLTIYTASDVANERYAQLLDGLQFKKAVNEAKEAIRAGHPFTALPEGFVVKGGTNEASRRAAGKVAEATADAEAAAAGGTGTAASTGAAAAGVAAGATVIEPSGEVPGAAAIAPVVEPVAEVPPPVSEPAPAVVLPPVVEPEPEPLVVPEPVIEPEPEPLVVPEPEPLVVPEPPAMPLPEPEPMVRPVAETEPPEAETEAVEGDEIEVLADSPEAVDEALDSALGDDTRP